MKAFTRLAAILAVPVAAGSVALAAGTAHAALTTVTAVTHVQNDPDSGAGGNTWSVDQITRTATVTVAADQGTTPSGFTKYTASISDTGTFKTIAGVLTPNQSVPGQKIAHAVTGSLTGAANYTVVAPNGDVLGNTFVASLNDNFTAPTGAESVGGWPLQAFTPPTGVTVTLDNWGWTYTTPAGESWTDSSAVGNNDGNNVLDGNITGLLALPPVVIRLSHGHGTSTAPTRETVSYQQSGAASWDEFYIVGPGKINGHKGWVNAKVGLNFGYYSGLLAHHGYTVYYTPVQARGSDAQIPGSHGGHVYFVSDAA